MHKESRKSILGKKRMKRPFSILCVMTLILSVCAAAYASSGYMTSFNNRYGTGGTALNTCSVCHTTTPSVNSYGNAFKNSARNYATIEPMDSDGDGFTNIVEINARTFPGNASSKPSGTDTAAPMVTGFSIPSTSNSLTVPITTFTATDNLGVAEYMLTEASTKPAASATGWSSAAPTNYAFTSAGAKTLYAWAKDAAGNVSASQSANVAITLPDTTPPTVTSFSIPSTSTSLTIPITSFTATDNVGVSSYLVTDTSATPSATASGWNASAPTSYAFTSAGTKTLYAWAKDAAGNISASRSASVTVTLPSDNVPPDITSFSMPSTSSSLTVRITAFTATDNVGVTSYLIKARPATPSVSSAKWRATAPKRRKFSTGGIKTLYAWAKDAAGNISARGSATVNITLPIAAATATNPMPAPSGQQVFTYEPTDVSITTVDPASAKPVSVGPIAVGGDTLSIHVSIGQLASPVNIYLTAYAPSDISGGQHLDVLTLTPDNNFEPLSDKSVPWRTGVTEVDEAIVSDIPISDLPKGTHLLVLTVTSPDNRNSYYQWVTYFTVQ